MDALCAHSAASAAAAAERLSCEAETGGREQGGAGRSYGGATDGCGSGGGPALRAAALRALAASVLAPAAHRPPFLPLALGLFRQVRPGPLLAPVFQGCERGSKLCWLVWRGLVSAQVSLG